MKTKNYYEEEVDAKLITEVYEKTGSVEIRDALYNACQNDTKIKRLLILSILDNDRSMYKNIRTIIKKTEVYDVKHIKHVVEMLRRYVEVGEKEQKAYGEVFTPYSLINDMLDTLPVETWSNPNLKVLDPCSGVGNFSAVMVDRFMNGLVEFEPDAEKRYKHIMENMIHVCELQTKNMFLFQCAFDPMDTINLNVYNGSFLNEDFDNHAKNVWGVDKFDLIVMNPPYQELKEGFKKSQPLWHLFVQKTISQLIEGGRLVAVHPTGWRNVDGVFKDTQRLMKSKQIEYLNMFGFGDGLKTFNAQIDYDYYCLRNVNCYDNTKIVCENDEVLYMNISDMEFIPSENIKQIFSLVAKNGEEKVNVLYSRSAYGTDKINMSKEQTGEFKHPCVYTVVKGGKINLMYSNTINNGHFNLPKVIWSNGSATSVIIDENGEYGLTQFSYAIVDSIENLEHIQKALNSEKFIKEIMVFKGLADIYNRKIISTFRKDFWKEFIN